MFIYLIDDVSKIILSVVIAIVIVSLLVAFFLLINGHRHAKRQVQDLTKRYDKLHALLVDQLSNDIKRVYSISQSNVEYESIYNINKNMYNEVCQQEDVFARKAVTELQKLLAEKKYNQIKDEYDMVKSKVIELEEKYNQLNASLSEIINVDDDNRQDMLMYKREFREIKSEYEQKKNELKYIESSFVNVFDKLEASFLETEKLLGGAHYIEAKEKLPEIERVLTALSKAIVILPKLCTLSYIAIPNSIKETSDRYNQLIEEKYPLHHLKFQTLMDSFDKTLTSIYERLGKFHTKNVESELNQIRDSLIVLNSDFDNEVASKKFFSSSYEEIYNGSYKLENKFIKLKRIIPDYKKTYLLKDTCVEDLNSIQNEINELGVIKRNLDTFVHASSQQPFSVLSSKLKDLDSSMKKIEDDIERTHIYLTSLKDDANNDYDYMTSTFIQLKKYEAILRKINVQSLTLTFNENFKKCYQLLNECGDLTSYLPIDVASLNEKVKEISLCFEEIKSRTSLRYPSSLKESKYGSIEFPDAHIPVDVVQSKLFTHSIVFSSEPRKSAPLTSAELLFSPFCCVALRRCAGYGYGGVCPAYS